MLSLVFAVTMVCGAPEPLPNDYVSAVIESGVLMDEVYGSHPYDLPTVSSEDGMLSYRIVVDPLYQSYGRCFSRQVRSILTDERSWPQIREADPGETPQVWIILAPPGVCRGEPHTSCAAGAEGKGQIWMNYLRWMGESPYDMGLDAQRTHVINHEVGHHLGYVHTSCATDGPNVMTPSSATSNCDFMEWPTLSSSSGIWSRIR